MARGTSTGGTEALEQVLNALPERERQVLILRFGLDSGTPRTLEEVGAVMGFSRERARQVAVGADALVHEGALSLERTPAAPPGAPVSFPSPTRALAALGAAAVLGCSSLLLAPAAWAHDSLVSSTPGDGTTVTNAPESVSLGFSSAPLQLGAQVQVTGPDGAVVTDGEPVVAGNDVVQGLADERPAGTYTVDWRVTSSDGHPIQGTVTFTAEGAVGASAAPSTAATSAPSSSAEPSATAEATATPSTTPASAESDSGSGISGETWAWTIAAGAAGALLGALLVRWWRRAKAS